MVLAPICRAHGTVYTRTVIYMIHKRGIEEHFIGVQDALMSALSHARHDTNIRDMLPRHATTHPFAPSDIEGEVVLCESRYEDFDAEFFLQIARGGMLAGDFIRRHKRCIKEDLEDTELDYTEDVITVVGDRDGVTLLCERCDAELELQWDSFREVE